VNDVLLTHKYVENPWKRSKKGEEVFEYSEIIFMVSSKPLVPKKPTGGHYVENIVLNEIYSFKEPLTDHTNVIISGKIIE